MPVLVCTSDQVLVMGLGISGFRGKRMKRVCMKTNLDRFGDSFGVSPVVCADIWVDLQTTTVPAARIDTKRKSCTLHTMLLSIRFLKKHDTEKDRSGNSKKCDRFCRDWGWCFFGKDCCTASSKDRVARHLDDTLHRHRRRHSVPIPRGEARNPVERPSHARPQVQRTRSRLHSRLVDVHQRPRLSSWTRHTWRQPGFGSSPARTQASNSSRKESRGGRWMQRQNGPDN